MAKITAAIEEAIRDAGLKDAANAPRKTPEVADILEDVLVDIRGMRQDINRIRPESPSRVNWTSRQHGIYDEITAIAAHENVDVFEIEAKDRPYDPVYVRLLVHPATRPRGHRASEEED